MKPLATRLFYYISLIFLLLLPCGTLYAKTVVKLEVTADNSIVLYPGEEHLNAGSKQYLRIKGNQHLLALKFDTSPLKGKTIEDAILVYHRRVKKIRAVTISTISAPWDEKKSSALTSGASNIDGWGMKGQAFIQVADGNGNSLLCKSKSVIKDDYYFWKVHPDLIYANVIGAAYGLCVHEDSADYTRNPTVYSIENNAFHPYLLVSVSEPKIKSPVPVSKAKLINTDNPEQLFLKVQAPSQGFTYEIKVNGKTVPRFCIPFIKPGTTQYIPLHYLDFSPGDKLFISISTINREGRSSKAFSIKERLPKQAKLNYPKVKLWKKKAVADANLAVIPIYDKYTKSGKPVGNLPEDYLTNNPVFDGSKVNLKGARGEVLGFQLLLKGTGKVKIECSIPDIKTELYKAIYVKTPRGDIPDPLVPFNELELQPDVFTVVVVDLYIPFQTKYKKMEGDLIISDGRKIPISLKIRKFSIPRKATFNCEMNSYGLPDKVTQYYALQEIAYNHRLYCNILHYSHNSTAPDHRKSTMDMRIDVGKNKNRRMNEDRYNNIKPGDTSTYWDDFKYVFGPYLSGQYFKNKHRGVIPAPGFYLTFHESWPLKVRKFFNGSPDAFLAFKDKPTYRETFINVLKSFIALADKNDWNKAGFQVYLNNKGTLDDNKKSPWVLDEPASLWDFRALRYYGELVKLAKGKKCPINLQYRIDISRPQFARTQLDDCVDLNVVNTKAFKNFNQLVMDKADIFDEKVWAYGTTNNVEDTNLQTIAWVLHMYYLGAEGVVPWQTVNKNGKAMKKGDQLGLFIFSKNEAGKTDIYHSLRLKAYRRIQQDIEYLNLLKKHYDLNSGDIKKFINHYLVFDMIVRKKDNNDAGTCFYNNITPDVFYILREATSKLIEKRKRK